MTLKKHDSAKRSTRQDGVRPRVKKQPKNKPPNPSRWGFKNKDAFNIPEDIELLGRAGKIVYLFTHVYLFFINNKNQITVEGMETALEKLKLKLATTSSPITGNRPYAENSQRVNKKHCRLLQYMCFLIGDYEGAIILQPNPPTNICPSTSARTIILAIKFKRGRKGTPPLR